MDKTFAYIPHSVLRFTVNTDGPVRIQGSGNPASGMALNLPVPEPYARLMGRWIIECTKNTILMRETASRAEEDDYIELLFQPPGAGVEAEHSSQTGRETSSFEHVDRIDVYPHVAGWFKVQLREPAADSGGTPAGVGNGPAQNAAGPVFSAAERTSLEGRIRQLETELAREQAYTKSLQETIEKRLDDALQMQDKEKKSLTSKNQEKQKKLVSQNKEIKKLQKDIEEAPAKIQKQNDELTVLQKQLRKLEEQREVIELDCDKAKKQVAELKAHVNLDAETAALLEEGDRLKRGTISKTLAEMDSEIKKVEKRIEFIIKFRSKFNQIVEDAILRGDGTISADEEAGGIADGNGSTTPGENT